MKLHILGCGDAFGSGGRHQSSYLIESRDRLFLLDCGPTTLLALKRAGFELRRLDAVILSHLHGGHFVGLPFIFIDYLYRQPKDTPIIIAGPPRTEEKVRELWRIMYGGGANKELPPVDFQILTPDQPTEVAVIDVRPFRVPHQSDEISLGLKIVCDGKQVLFSGDSLWTENFIEQARGSDLFLCECSFYREQPGMHVNFKALQANLARLTCRQLLLTHLGEEMLAHRDELGVKCAQDGMVIEI
jgi:ribonuclease BN (tRNA processing enzyme)